MSFIGSRYVGSGHVGRSSPPFLAPSYWQARARLLLGYARAFLHPDRAAATFGATPSPGAAFTPTVVAQASFGNPVPKAKFAPPGGAATIKDPDATATIVT